MSNPSKRKTLTERGIAALKPIQGKRRHVFDSIIPGLAVRVTERGVKSFVLITRVHGKQRWITLGRVGVLSLADARTEAGKGIVKAKAGEDPRPRLVLANDFNSIVDSFIERWCKHVKPNGQLRNRSWRDVRRIFDVYVLPEWRDRPITSITRRDVTELLDRVEDDNGAVMSDRVLGKIRKIFNWYATRDDQFNSPIVAGMARTSTKERERKRVLSDDELRALWPLLDQPGTFRGIARMLLLTAQRRSEVAGMLRSEISADVWTISAERTKTDEDYIVPLTGEALAVIEAQPVINDCDFVFSTNGNTAFSGFSKSKQELDKALAKAMNCETIHPWVLHDLRRTAKTLMQRAGVEPFISERVLGHVVPGVEGIYDRFGYAPQKRDALERLAAEIRRILTPPPDNVVRLRAK
ncbi:MAG: integrase arm-type DNA-binding domain-containing protein [Proteobacteria bacterium]|nr:integrase arm-type DNA-binding domain-containing protein [Pseudomonadota bacterium]